MCAHAYKVIEKHVDYRILQCTKCGDKMRIVPNRKGVFKWL